MIYKQQNQPTNDHANNQVPNILKINCNDEEPDINPYDNERID